MSPDIQDEIKASIAVKEATLKDEHLLSQLSDLIDACLSSLQQGGKIIFCGKNGCWLLRYVNRNDIQKTEKKTVLKSLCKIQSNVG